MQPGFNALVFPGMDRFTSSVNELQAETLAVFINIVGMNLG